MIIDELMHQLFQLPYDAEGRIAQQGTIIPKLQTQLRNHSYFDQAPLRALDGNYLVKHSVINY